MGLLHVGSIFVKKYKGILFVPVCMVNSAMQNTVEYRTDMIKLFTMKNDFLQCCDERAQIKHSTFRQHIRPSKKCYV